MGGVRGGGSGITAEDAACVSGPRDAAPLPPLAVGAMPVAAPRDTEAGSPPQVSLGELMDRFGTAGVGAVLFLLAIPAFLPIPLPTGIPAGAAMVLIAWQIGAGTAGPLRLPGWIRRFSLRRDHVSRGGVKLMRALRRLGLRLRPRAPGWLAGPARGWMALTLAVCGAVIILPIPFGNQLPSLAVGAIGLGLLRRDGMAVAVGHALGVLAMAWTAVLFTLGNEAIDALVPAWPF